ncbi:ABC transporter substrate-binding protein [Anaerocolumna sedimenticola]|uniref:ABC transporter substrate-binding protein n=1 Tax=Anaerocolumna sedimenticola TaxID=2696063 RepID=A0A6P1TPY5_9FIRM|nr:ABC transporter substrate-binding protein [Anaerocolumna sedimenticola]QHQ63044.1 ABC transporter substrate-binding protein [Anaerocolumna sedimenticola]
MKRRKHLTALLLVLTLVVTSLLAGCKKNDTADTSGEATTTPTVEATTPEPTEEPTPEPTEAATTESQDAATVAASLPREETLYFSGQQWGAINDYNPFSSNSNNWWIEQNDDARVMVYETLFMYNQNDGKLYGLLADSYEQKDKEFTVKLKPAAKWSDGTPVTADDVVYTFDAHKRLNTAQGSQFAPYIDSVKAVDPQTVVFTASSENYNPLKVLEVFPKVFIVNKAQMSKLEADNGNDADKIKTAKNENLIASGPYKPYYDDETKVVVVRDDNYWGQDASMWGKLPAPKYLAHNIFIDNNAGAVAFEKGEVDVSQQFMSEVWKMWEDGKPVSTYLDDAPYYACVTLPTAIFNVTKPGLDQAAVRKALAMATDYEQIATTAMSGYTPLMSDAPPALMNPTDPERALIDEAQLKDLQWKGKQIDEAKALLDKAGIKDADGDGIREYDGKNIAFTVQCPSGWTDWNSALEMVAAAGQAIGLDVTTLWTTAAEWTTNRLTGNFDVIMNSYPGASISNPWTRCYQTMYSTPAKEGQNADWNFGRYSNPEADKIIEQIPTETDQAKLKALYTQLNKIYLTDVPAFALMYRPGLFHTVNESVWTGFPQADDGTNVPPTVLTDGYGIAGLYNLTLVK